MSLNATTTVTGLVERCNDRGLLLAGEETWRNVSKFAEGCPDPLQFDRREVTLTLDTQGYIRYITESSSDESPIEMPTIEPDLPADPLPIPSNARPEPLSRDVFIARQVALRAAVDTLAADATNKPGSPDSEASIELGISQHSVTTTTLAAVFEEWLLRK